MICLYDKHASALWKWKYMKEVPTINLTFILFYRLFLSIDGTSVSILNCSLMYLYFEAFNHNFLEECRMSKMVKGICIYK